MKLSIIVPVLNEAQQLLHALESLASVRARGVEVIVVDGGSGDEAAAAAGRMGVRLVSSSKGRARQMNAGARIASGEVLLFLHVDTVLPENAELLIETAMRDRRRIWGRFDVDIRGRSWMLTVIAALMNWRSRVSAIATGDQGIFVVRSAFESVGGYPDQPLMEDIELCKRLRVLSPPACLRARAVTSGRRWESRGVWHTIILMWRLRWAYWRGVPASVLASMYE
ncbi:MAG TPA: TIGR04283 family arsenosugar biosynthesis glycosyltransferase [Steroidobacteraceae bacterium]|jgi:rSAM/selenodomain-associated transferase 2